MWTPADSSGEILWEALDRHLASVLDAGVQGIMALGSTGEFVHLTLAQRKALLERVIRACQARGRQVIANVSDVQVRNVIDLGRHAHAAGAHCLAVLPPWFFALEQRDLAEFFLTAARGVGAPIALYNYPEVTGKKISLETIEYVARRTKVMAVKQSGAEFEYHKELLRLGKQLGFDVLTGADMRLAEALSLGCVGTISGLANVVPRALSSIFENSGRGVASSDLTALVNDLLRQISRLNFPFNVQAAVAARGFETGAPKMPMSPETEKIYSAVVNDLTAWFQGPGRNA